VLLAGSAYHAGASWWQHALQQPVLVGEREPAQVQVLDQTRVAAVYTGVPVQVAVNATVGR
jgi:hypothetical protein